MQLKLQILTLCLLTSSMAQGKIVESVLAVVEGRMILQSDVLSFRKKLTKKTLINENLISLLNLNTKSKSKILDYLIAKKIITVFAQKNLNILNIDEIINKELLTLAKKNQMSVKQLTKKIKSKGINFDHYKTFIGESSLIRSVLEKNVVTQVRPTEEDFVSYLKQNNVSSIVPSYLYDLDQIFILKTSPKALKLAKSITKENFKNYFKTLKTAGTKLGSLKESDLSKAHSKAVFPIQQNNISSVLTEPKGYRIFYVNSKRSRFNVPNTPRVRSLQQEYYNKKIKLQFNSWFNKIKPQFFVRIND